MKNKTLENFLFVLKCPVCGEPLPLGEERDGVLCKVCRSKYVLEKERVCSDCGFTASECRCIPEILSKAGAETLLKLAFYGSDRETAVDRLILYLKDNRDARVERFVSDELSRLLERYFHETDTDTGNVVFTFAPRSPFAVNDKGFDQARVLADGCAGYFGSYTVKTVKRTLFGKRQKGLDTLNRRRNASKTFKAVKGSDVSGKTVVLIDDIVTTGASLAACVRIIKKAGAKRIICLSIARTERKNAQKTSVPQGTHTNFAL